MERFKEDKNRVTHKIVNFPYSVEGQREFISEIVERKEKASFGDVFGDMVNRLHAIVTFLALLDLINTQKIRINVGESPNSFWLEKGSPEDVRDVFEEALLILYLLILLFIYF